MRKTHLGVILALLSHAIVTQASTAQLSITRLRGSIAVDGDLTDSGWDAALRIEQFVEYWRGDNTAPPVPTVALLTYDDRALYVAFRAVDPNPASIRMPFVDRDKVLGDQDFVAVILDTQNDRRSSINLRVNPRGIQTDSVTNDANGVEDFSPDFFYESVARQAPDGWVAEMRIPFSSLRYPKTSAQSWGLILLRNYARDFRYIMASTTIPKSSNCFVCHAATLTGLEGLPTGDHMTLTPYSTAQSSEQRIDGLDSGFDRNPFRSDAGFDLKWNRSSMLTIDATLNPDFSQVESDVPQLSVNARFALDQPEKRPFFLEGVDLLSTPIRAVHTRTIAAPAWGLRATGQAGSGSYTLLVTEDSGGGSLILPGALSSSSAVQDFSSRVLIGRYRRSLGQSMAGFLATSREVAGGGHNRLFGPDFVWKPTTADRLQGQVVLSGTTNPDRPDLSEQFRGNSFSGHGGRFIYTRDVARYDVWVSYVDYSPGFRADNGFVPQVGFRLGYAEVAGHIYPKKGFFSFIRPYFAIDHGRAYDGGATTRRGIFPGVFFQGKWGSDGWITLRGAEGERVGSRLIDYSFVEFSLRTNPWRMLPLLKVDGTLGQKIDYAGARLGQGGRLGVSATVRPTDHLEVQADSTHEWLDLPEGRLFTAQLERLKIAYTLSARSLVRAIVQYSDVERNRERSRQGSLTTSALYAYKLTYQTVFFVGYGDEQLMNERHDLRRHGRSLFMKVAYAFQR